MKQGVIFGAGAAGRHLFRELNGRMPNVKITAFMDNYAHGGI